MNKAKQYLNYLSFTSTQKYIKQKFSFSLKLFMIRKYMKSIRNECLVVIPISYCLIIASIIKLNITITILYVLYSKLIYKYYINIV
jgi:hypothetical protein